MTEVILSSYVDVKDFRILMRENDLIITNEEEVEDGFKFSVTQNTTCIEPDLDAYIEGLMVYTSMEWKF